MQKRAFPLRTRAGAAVLLGIAQAGCGQILGVEDYGPTKDNGAVQTCSIAECGVYVALEGDDSGAGTKESPLRTLQKAIDLAQKANKTVHICAQQFQEAIEVPAGTMLEGGLNCQGEWESIAGLARTEVIGRPDEIPVRLLSGEGATRLLDIEIIAVDANQTGGSSIAMIVDHVSAELVHCSVSAGNGVDGEKGSTPTTNVGSVDNPSDPSVIGGAGMNACMGTAAGNPGGVGAINMLCMEAAGGNGGNGAIEAGSGQGGTDGMPPSASGKGQGGIGDTGTGCEPGGYGQDGMMGVAGLGAMDVGTLDAQGYVGSAGAAGQRGGTGQAGGGGGGGKGKIACNGASGGGGGAGGCGGFGGSGGTAGGASIAIVSLKSTLSLVNTNLKTGNGGSGGEGGDGQIGGIGGKGGQGGLLVQGTTKGCNGGLGGSGGSGGVGGGGRGGHSLGIAFTHIAPPTTGWTASLGTPGNGGLGSGPTGNGSPGLAQNSLEFPAP